MKHISVAIPAYEMHGKGPAFLAESFERLLTQKFTDFDVVVSDNSETSVIKDVCDQYTEKLTITYVKNDDPFHGMSSNVNNALKHATGKIIKILFLDDFLLDENSLQLVANNFDLSHDTWLATGCLHTKDGADLFNPHAPKYNDKIHLGKNTIGSPSVLAIKNEKVQLFDTHLKWLMDCEYYKRLHEIFGAPKLVAAPAVVIRTGDHQVTRTEVTKNLIRFEREYVEEKHSLPKNFQPIKLPSVTLVAVSGIDPERAAKALELSMIGMEYGDVMLISHEPPARLDPRIRFVQCKDTELASRDPKNTDDYSRFMAYELANYITTDHALIVHHNARILRPHKWNPEFLNYDYIGAPWPKHMHYTKSGTEVRVGNGGFSLRSKRLLSMLNDLKLPFTDAGTGYFHEDGIICVYYREELEKAGITFAPVELAAQFSHELDVPESVKEPFGFHDYPASSRGRRITKLVRKFRRLLCS